MNRPVSLKQYDFSDQKAALQTGLRTAASASRLNNVNSQAQQAGVGNAQAQYQEGINQMFGEGNRQNINVLNHEALTNTQINAGNNQKLDEQARAVQARQANILGLQSQARADVSNKSMSLLAENNKQQLDKQKYQMFLAWLNKNNMDTRNPDRQLYLDWLGSQGKTQTNRMGGVINRKSSKLLAC